MTNSTSAAVGTNPGIGRVHDGVTLSVADRHYLCSCTWIAVDRTVDCFRLKYRNAACLASAWHARIERSE